MNNRRKIYFILPIFLLFNVVSSAKPNKDEIRLVPGTQEYESYMNKKHCDETINSQRAWMYSAILPGLGQIHNKQTMRAVVIWGVFAGLFGGAYYCHKEYIKYFHENPHNPPAFVKTYKKVRDSLLFVSAIWYIANILDAYVGARLLTYDISDNISVQVVPHVHSAFSSDQSVGLSFGFNFK